MLNYMNVFTVCFFGHREVDNFIEIEDKIYEIVSDLIRNKEYVEFIVGRNGVFDQIVTSEIIKAKKNIFDASSTLTLILPYITSEYSNNAQAFNEYYDAIEIFDTSDAYFKSSFQKRNREMVNRSDLCIFYVAHKSGGAYQTMKYAEKQKKHYINIAT